MEVHQQLKYRYSHSTENGIENISLSLRVW